jgi:phage gp45-like
MIKQAITTRVTDDSETYPQIQLYYNGDTVFATRISPYGVCSNPVLDSFNLVFNANGNASSKFSIPVDFITRLKGLKEGETALYNSKTGVYVYIKDDGTVLINAPTQIDGDVTINGNLSVSDNLDVGGNIDAGGDVTATGEVTGNGIALSTHTHAPGSYNIPGVGGVAGISAVAS